MREIKFRIWNTRLKMMVEANMISGILLSMDERSMKENELMQFTGLKDKNGKEIYEGDVVKIRDRDKCFEIRISSRTGTGFWRGNAELGDDNDASDPVYIDWDEIEVIGNVWENPELLNK